MIISLPRKTKHSWLRDRLDPQKIGARAPKRCTLIGWTPFGHTLLTKHTHCDTPKSKLKIIFSPQLLAAMIQLNKILSSWKVFIMKGSYYVCKRLRFNTHKLSLWMNQKHWISSQQLNSTVTIRICDKNQGIEKRVQKKALVTMAQTTSHPVVRSPTDSNIKKHFQVASSHTFFSPQQFKE